MWFMESHFGHYFYYTKHDCCWKRSGEHWFLTPLSSYTRVCNYRKWVVTTHTLCSVLGHKPCHLFFFPVLYLRVRCFQAYSCEVSLKLDFPFIQQWANLKRSIVTQACPEWGIKYSSLCIRKQVLEFLVWCSRKANACYQNTLWFHTVSFKFISLFRNRPLASGSCPGKYNSCLPL